MCIRDRAKTGGTKALGRQPRGRRKKREPGRGHYDKDRPAIIAWVSRQGGVVIQATRDFTVKTVQKAADLAVQTGSRLYTDSASSYRALKGYVHDFVNHTKKEYARGGRVANVEMTTPITRCSSFFALTDFARHEPKQNPRIARD